MLKFLILAAMLMGSIQLQAQTNKELEEKINTLAEQVEELKMNKSSSNLTFGGYGELTYQKVEEGEKDTDGKEPVYDNKRFILYVGYDFSPKWKLVSEIEIEHANEIYTEQAYLEYSKSDQLKYRVGTLLIPMGHLNLWHEPTTFLGTQRTQVESRIIPSTWRENGAGIYGKKDKLEYHLYYVTGLNAVAGTGAEGMRSGRQKASKANAHKGAFVGRLDYKVMANSEFGVSVYNGKLNNTVSDVAHNVYDIHYKGTFGALQTRALWTELTLSNTKELNSELGTDSEGNITNYAEKMNGYYLEVGYDVLHGKSDWQAIPFIRYEGINTHAEVDDSISEDESQEQIHQTLGVVFKPMANISLKADYTKTTNKDESGTDSWNLGAAWNF